VTKAFPPKSAHAQRRLMTKYGIDTPYSSPSRTFKCRVVNQLPHDAVWNDVCREFEDIYRNIVKNESYRNDKGEHLHRWILSGGPNGEAPLARRLLLEYGTSKPS
jgi:hypothetical protein